MNLGTVVRALSFAAIVASGMSMSLGSGALAQEAIIPTSQTPSRPAIASSQGDLPSAREATNSNALNWAGYTSTGGTYTSVSGSWIVPSVTNAGADNVADATWVGIGGVVSDDLIQAGTEALPESDGTMAYRAWMETLPDDSRVVPLTISAGDAVSVSITEESQGVWDVSFDDATTGKTYTATVQYDSSFSSADWIEEMPVEVGGIVGLDDFGTIDFTAGYAIKNGQAVSIAGSGAKPLVMTNSSGEVVAQPSSLGTSGSDFTVTRTDAISTPLALSRNGVSAVAVAQAPYALLSGYGTLGGGYRVRTHRGRSGYRVFIEF